MCVSKVCSCSAEIKTGEGHGGEVKATCKVKDRCHMGRGVNALNGAPRLQEHGAEPKTGILTRMPSDPALIPGPWEPPLGSSGERFPEEICALTGPTQRPCLWKPRLRAIGRTWIPHRLEIRGGAAPLLVQGGLPAGIARFVRGACDNFAAHAMLALCASAGNLPSRESMGGKKPGLIGWCYYYSSHSAP